MKKVKLITLSEQDKKDLEDAYKKEKDPQISLEELIENNKNHTLSVLKQIKNIYEWKDIEKMVEYVLVLKKVKEAADVVELDNDEYYLVMEVFKGAVESGKIAGHAMEKLVEIYQEFKNPQ